LDAIRAGATLIDIRSDSQIAKDGVVPEALVISLNVLEWRLDPASEHRHPSGPDLDDQVILMCNEANDQRIGERDRSGPALPRLVLNPHRHLAIDVSVDRPPSCLGDRG
jgi:hypothetical protein